MPLVPLVLIGGVLMTTMMAGLWVVQRTKGDAGVVDVGWTAGLGILAVYYALFAGGDVSQRFLVGALAGLWSARLALYVYFDRVRGRTEDGRYQALRARYGQRAQWRFFVFFEVQAVVAVLMSLPFLVIACHTARLSGWSYAAVVVWAVAICGESLADWQLAAFRADPSTRGLVCRRGLWRYSRHPNYFFEWLHWWTYVIAAIGAPWWGLTFVGPAFITFFLFRVTGIPVTEREALRSRGDAYREYQRTTSVFVPWPPRRDGVATDAGSCAGS
jgi:steroid 5-alpha reductase family enzyme